MKEIIMKAVCEFCEKKFEVDDRTLESFTSKNNAILCPECYQDILDTEDFLTQNEK
jgi:uncharacterized protein YlaI